MHAEPPQVKDRVDFPAPLDISVEESRSEKDPVVVHMSGVLQVLENVPNDPWHGVSDTLWLLLLLLLLLEEEDSIVTRQREENVPADIVH